MPGSPRATFSSHKALRLLSSTATGPITLFTALQGCPVSDHNGITFDHFGTFGFEMIVTCREGHVFRVHGDGTETQIAGPFGVEIEGPAVVPAGFGPHGGQIWWPTRTAMLSTQSGTIIHQVPVLIPFFQISSSRSRGRRLRYPVGSVRLLLGRRLLPGVYDSATKSGNIR